jgi:hypothetical protein
MNINIQLDFNKNNSNNYQGINPVSHASTEASIDIATISNYKLDKVLTIDSSVVLTPYDLSFVDFMSCFYYHPGGAFSINPLNYSFKPMLLTTQSYVTTDHKKFYWNLYNQCLKTYCEKHSLLENSISSFKKIELTKETFRHQSLASNCGTQMALGWDIVLESLQTTNQIRYTKDPEHSASVNFKLHYVFYSQVLDVTVECTFVYRCGIPCYRNVYNSPEDHTALLGPYNKKEVLDEVSIPQVRTLPKSKKQKVQHRKEKQFNSYYEPSINNNNCELTINDYVNDTESVMTKNILSALQNDDQETQMYEEEEDDDISFSMDPTYVKAW